MCCHVSVATHKGQLVSKILSHHIFCFFSNWSFLKTPYIYLWCARRLSPAALVIWLFCSLAMDTVTFESSLMARLKLVPAKSTSSDPTNRRLIPPKPSTSLLVSKSSVKTEAAKLSNWTPAGTREVARDGGGWPLLLLIAELLLLIRVGEFSEDDVPLKSNKSLSIESKLLVVEFDIVWLFPFDETVGVWTEYTSPMAESKLTHDLAELAEQCLDRFKPQTEPDLRLFKLELFEDIPADDSSWSPIRGAAEDDDDFPPPPLLFEEFENISSKESPGDEVSPSNFGEDEFKNEADSLSDKVIFWWISWLSDEFESSPDPHNRFISSRTRIKSSSPPAIDTGEELDAIGPKSAGKKKNVFWFWFCMEKILIFKSLFKKLSKMYEFSISTKSTSQFHTYQKINQNFWSILIASVLPNIFAKKTSNHSWKLPLWRFFILWYKNHIILSIIFRSILINRQFLDDFFFIKNMYYLILDLIALLAEFTLHDILELFAFELSGFLEV